MSTMKLLLTLLLFITFVGIIVCGVVRLDAERVVAINSNEPTKLNHHRGEGRGRGQCNGTGTIAPNGFPSTTRASTLSSLLPFPAVTVPGQTPFPNIDVRDTELVG